MTRYTVHFSGMVQGVGFRMTAAHLARGFAVAGYVQNLADGRVKMVAEGDRREIEALIETIRQHMGRYIEQHTIDKTQGTGEFGRPNRRSGFDIRY